MRLANEAVQVGVTLHREGRQLQPGEVLISHAAGQKRLVRETREWHETLDVIAVFLAPSPEAT